MSSSGPGSGHHRTFSRPNSSLARFASSSPQGQGQGSGQGQGQHSPLIHHQSYQFSSLPGGTHHLRSSGSVGGGGSGSGSVSGRLQRHQSFIHNQGGGVSGGFGGSLDSADYIRTLELIKDEDNPSFGFNIKGGTDYGTPVHIWRVEENSLADQKGLRRGQRILSANGADFTRISHGNALKVLKGRSYLKLLLDTRMNGDGGTVPLNKSASNSMVVETSCSSSLGGGVGGGGGSGYNNFRGGGTISSSSCLLNNPVSSGGSGSSSVLGMVSASSNYSYTWIDASGKIVPPPAPSASSITGNKRVINIDINPGQNLGLMIRGGYEYGLGIYVTGVDHGSVAQRGGLQRGDELLEVNGRSFTSITHDKAVQILKSCRKMTIVANYIGKIPADTQTSGGGGGVMPLLGGGGGMDGENSELIDLGGGGGGNKLLTTSMSESMTHHHAHSHAHNILIDSTNVTLFDDDDQDLLAEEEKLNDQNLELDYAGGVSDSSRLLHQDLEKSTSIMGMIEEKARTVLTKSEHSRFTFYRLEYQQGFLPIQTFVRILLELLNTVEKYTLLTEVREIIRPGDMVAFDELIYNKEACIGGSGGGGVMGKKQQMHRDFQHPGQHQGQGQGHLQQGGMNMSLPVSGPGGVDPMLLPLVPVGGGGIPLNLNNPSQQGGPMNGPGGGVVRRYSPHTINNPIPSSSGGPVTHYNMNTMYNETTFTNPSMTSTPTLVENNRQILLTHGDTQNVVAKLQQQKLAQGFVGGGQVQGMTPHTPNSCVRYKVRVQKTKPILGIAIEGGINTPHRLPRIIDVNTEGSAYGSQLKPGQVLLTVDGKKLDGLSHEEIARCILDSYVDMSKPQIEFYVVEAKASFVQSQQQQQQQLVNVGGGGHATPMIQIPPPPNSSGVVG